MSSFWKVMAFILIDICKLFDNVPVVSLEPIVDNHVLSHYLIGIDQFELV